MTDRALSSAEVKKARLADPRIHRWYSNLARGSEITASNYLRCLFGFSRRTGIDPARAAKLSKKAAYETLLDFVAAEEKRGLAGSAVHTYVKSVKSWLDFNGIKVTGKIRVTGAQSTPTIANETVPSQDTLRKILLAAGPKVRVAIGLMAFSGLRPEVIGDYRGKDGLRVKDLPDLKVGATEAVFGQLPARVVVRGELSKTGHPYFTFIGSEGASYISAFLEERMRQGERIAPDTDIFRDPRFGKQFVKTTNISESIRRVFDKVGFDARPYVLRSYFDTQLLLAESKGKVAHDYRVFWMGHRGSMDARYTTNKGRLPQELLEDMASSYRACETFLSVVPQRAENRAENLEVILAELLREKGASDEQIDAAITGRMSPEEVGDLVRRLATAGPARVLLAGDDAKARMMAGWNPVATFPDGSIVLEGPVGPLLRPPLPAGSARTIA